MKTLLEKEEFERLLAESVKTHGHLCPGQVLGVRLAMLGLKLIGIQDPKGADRKKFLVYVEIDRCATDAIQSVTGCTLGKRSLKFVDYGIMAATFVNLETNRAFRIVAREEARKLADGLFPEIDDRYRRQLEAYKALSDDDLFQVEEVKVDINEVIGSKTDEIYSRLDKSFVGPVPLEATLGGLIHEVSHRAGRRGHWHGYSPRYYRNSTGGL